MSHAAAGRLPDRLPAELTEALLSLRAQHAGKQPTAARTDVRGNVVTCVLIDAGDCEGSAYKSDAAAAVVRLTRQRVASVISRHDRETDVATETFVLEPSLARGEPRPEARANAALARR